MIKNNASLLAAHARDVIKQLSAKSCKIATAIENWNEGVKQAGFDGVYDFPTQGYTRKAQIIADLERCAAQLDAHVEPVKRTVLGKVISGATKRAGSYGRFIVGLPISHSGIDCSKSYGGALSTNDMKHGCYSVAAFKLAQTTL